MRYFPPAFAAQVARRNGAAPVWLLRFTAAGTDYILCQDAMPIAPWGKTALPWISSWGQLTEGVSSTLADFNISSLNIDLINDPTAAPNLRTLAKNRSLNGITMSVYLWVDGCTAAPHEMNSYVVTEIDLPDEASVNLSLQDQSSKYENFYPGTIVTKEAYPEADPDDVGKVIPMPFGTVSKLNALALDSGRMTSIPNEISATTTSIPVSDTTGLTAAMLLQIDEEIISIVSTAGSVLTVTRGVSGTQATTHQRGAVAWEVKDAFVYAVADYPLTAMPKAYGRVGQVLMDISELCTVWPSGNHPDYPGLAVISVPGYITLTQAVEMLVDDGIGIRDLLLVLDGTGVLDGMTVSDNVGVNDLLEILDGGGVSDTIAVSDLIGISESIAVSPPSISNAAHVHSGNSSINQPATNCPLTRGAVGDFTPVAFPALSGARTAVSYQLTLRSDSNIGGGVIKIYVNGVLYINDVSNFAQCVIGKSNTYQFSIYSADFAADAVTVYMGFGNGTSPMTITGSSRNISYVENSGSTTPANTVSGATKSGTVSRTGSVSKTGGATKTGTVERTGTITKTGNAYREGTITKTGTVTRSGNILKTGTVTVTGNSVANTLIGDAILVDVVSPITAPHDVITKLLGPTCSLVGAFPAGFAFNGAITTSRRAPEWCHELARQCRSYFKWKLGQPTLIVRPDVLTPVKSITEIRLNNGAMAHGQRQTDINDVINTINLRYDRDWSSTSSGDEIYQQVAAGTDAASITTYGVRERPELFRFDFVTSPTMAANLLAFYLAWQAWQRWQHTQEAYLFEAALEFADAVTLAFLGGEIGECTEVGFSPGNGTNIDKIQLTVIE